MLALLPALLLLTLVEPPAHAIEESQTVLPPPISMPADRAAASYQIYSILMPIGETGNPTWPHDLWLIQDTTIALVPVAEPCSPSIKNGQDSEMNPHTAVHPAEEGREDFAEILQDFDGRCHDRIALEANKLKAKVSVRLLNEEGQKEFRRLRSEEHSDPALASKYKGAPALYAFSEVYFNAHATVALVYATQWCGSLCAQGSWIALALRDGHWHSLNWGSDSWISRVTSGRPCAPKPQANKTSPPLLPRRSAPRATQTSLTARRQSSLAPSRPS